MRNTAYGVRVSTRWTAFGHCFGASQDYVSKGEDSLHIPFRPAKSSGDWQEVIGSQNQQDSGCGKHDTCGQVSFASLADWAFSLTNSRFRSSLAQT